MRIKNGLFFKHLARQRWPVLIASGVLLAQAVVAVQLPMPMRFMMNRLLVPAKGASLALPGWLDWAIPQSSDKLELLAAAIAWLLALCLAAAALELAQDYWIARAVNRIIEGVREELLELLLTRRAAFMDSCERASLVGRVSADTANLESILAVGLPTMVRALPTLVMILAVLAQVDRTCAWAMLAMVLVMYLLNSRFSSLVRSCARQGRREATRFEHHIHQILAAFPLIKSLSLEGASLRLTTASARAITGISVRTSVYESALGCSLSGVKNLMRASLLALGGPAVLRGEMPVGDLVLFLSYVESVSSPVNELSKFALKLAKATVGSERIEELAASARAEPESDGPRALEPEGPLPLRLSGVSLAYPRGPVVLRSFCAYLSPGDAVALAGASGAGKTSVLKLFNRLADPTQGEVLLGGRPLTDFRLRDLRAYVTAIPQEEFFVSGTVRDNLLLARRWGATDLELWAALERVNARDFVAALPAGLDTSIGEGAFSLSGGEQRRLSVARAFLRPPRGIFVFDEPTSGLDPGSAGVFIASALELAARRSIVLWSTHRVAELEAASRVLFFPPNQNPVLASHRELLSSLPAYAAFLKAEPASPPAESRARQVLT